MRQLFDLEKWVCISFYGFWLECFGRVEESFFCRRRAIGFFTHLFHLLSFFTIFFSFLSLSPVLCNSIWWKAKKVFHVFFLRQTHKQTSLDASISHSVAVAVRTQQSRLMQTNLWQWFWCWKVALMQHKNNGAVLHFMQFRFIPTLAYCGLRRNDAINRTCTRDCFHACNGSHAYNQMTNEIDLDPTAKAIYQSWMTAHANNSHSARVKMRLQIIRCALSWALAIPTWQSEWSMYQYAFHIIGVSSLGATKAERSPPPLIFLQWYFLFFLLWQKLSAIQRYEIWMWIEEYYYF